MSSTRSTPLTVLLDNGIFSHSEFAETATTQQTIRWAGTVQTTTIHGIKKKRPDNNGELQTQIDALPTVGRLIREGVIEAYEYREIWCERMRYRPLLPFGNVLRGCEIMTCNAPLERTRFMQTTDISEYLSKGGKKEARSTRSSQISFLEMLSHLDSKMVQALIAHAHERRLTKFEIESLNKMQWFQFLCERSGREKYPDIFHLWAAERNGLQFLLTLDNDLPELVSRVKGERRKKIGIATQVLRPMELLNQLGIRHVDPVPLEEGRFYPLHEVD